MYVNVYKTGKIIPNDNILTVLDKYLPPLKDGDIVAVTSKIVSLCQNDIVKKSPDLKKDDLIKAESEYYYDARKTVKYGIIITLNKGIFGASGGIDESNADGLYVKLPDKPFTACEKIWGFLKKKNNISKLGVIITDSHSSPFRYGVTGIGLAWCGFYPLYDYGKTNDIWKQSIKGTVTNHLDALSVTAVHAMGEGNEQTPLCVISGDEKIVFNNNPPTADEIKNFSVPFDKDIYTPIFNNEKWQHR